MSGYAFASEVAWRLLSIDYRKTLDDIMCSPKFAEEFDRLAMLYGPEDITSLEYRRAAFSIRKRTKPARLAAQKELDRWSRKSLNRNAIDDCLTEEYECPGIFVLCSDESGIYAGESENIREHLELFRENPNWQRLNPDSIFVERADKSFTEKCAMKSALVWRSSPLLNCRLWVDDSELPK